MIVSPVHRPPRGEQLLDQVRALIVRGELEPGTHLVEGWMAERFGVSRGPVRDALRQLELEGLVDTRRRGVFVRGASTLLARLDELDPASLAAVVEIFERRRWLLHLMGDALRRSVSSSGVVVSIGAENAFYNLVGTSLVAAAYSHRERPYGVVSLIGPKRMDYDAAISTVRSAAEALTYRLSAGI
jgi:transcriptional regulator of heat shock response